MKFCSRCGLLLSGLIEWLSLSGLPAGREQEAQAALHSPRRKGVRRGAKVMFFGGALFPIFLVLSIAVDEPFPLFVPIITFLIGLTITLYSQLFVEEFPLLQGQQSQRFGPATKAAGQALPPASTTPAQAHFAGQQVRTNELAQPPSVTEQTTKLLDQE
jgi:hypothetical protein